MGDRSYARAALYTQYKREQDKEMQNWEDYFNAADQDALESDQYSFIGSIIGGIGGFVLSAGNPYGAYLGYQVGKQAKYLNPEETKMGPKEWFEEQGMDMSGGLFEGKMMENNFRDVILQEEEQDLAELITTGTDILAAYTTTGGFSPDKLSTGFTGLEDVNFLKPSTWKDIKWDPEAAKTFSGKEIPTVEDFFLDKLGLGKDKLDPKEVIEEVKEEVVDSSNLLGPAPEINLADVEFSEFDDPIWERYMRT
jgi:hypothetical protein